MNANELKEIVVDALEDLKGIDIKVLDVRDKSDVTDILVIGSGTSTRQIAALAESVREKVKERGIQPISVEGDQASGWVLVDLGDVVVHVMLPETRDFYNLEKLWSESAPESHSE